MGEELSKALNPAQQVIKIVLEELTTSLGGEAMKITYASKPPTVVLMAGLQGAGKTTNTGKLAQWFKKQGRNPLLVGADLQRPAAVEQLRTLAGQVGVPVFSEPSDPVTVASKAIDEANRTGRDVVIVDTAGRLAIDEELMEQVRQISGQVQPDYTFLVIDAMTGQDAVNTAKAFNETLELDGVILTKLDGDARVVRRCPSKRSSASRSPSPPPARNSTSSRRSTRIVSPAASSAWVTSRPSSRRPRRPSSRNRPKRLPPA